MYRFFALLFFVSFPLFASSVILDKIEVRDKKNLSSLSFGVTDIIESSEIEKMGAKSLYDIFYSLPEFDLSRSGGVTSLSYEGLPPEQINFLVDGVSVLDPTHPSRRLDLSNISTKNIEKIYITKGINSFSSSGASTVVINIETKKGNKDKLNLGLLEGKEKGGDLSFFKVFNKGRMGAHSSYLKENNKSLTRGTDEYDKRELLSNSVFFEINPLKDLLASFHYEAIKKVQEYDGYDLNNEIIDDHHNVAITEDSKLLMKIDYEKKDSLIHFNSSKYKILRKQHDAYPNVFEGENIQNDLTYSNKFSESFSLTLGHSITDEKMKAKKIKQKKVSGYSSFIKGKSLFNSYHFDYGARLVSQAKSPSVLLGELGFLKSLKNKDNLGANFNLGQRTPSLYNIYDGDAGNKNLTQERSTNLEVSYKNSSSKLHPSVSYFHHKINNLIFYDFDPVTFRGKYKNEEGETEINGFKTSIASELTSFSSFNLSYKNQNFSKKIPGRISRDSAKFMLKNNLRGNHYLIFFLSWTGTRFDGEERLKEYYLGDLVYSYDKERFTLSFKIENLFNEDYEMVKGYSVDRRNYSLNLSYSFL